MVAVVDAVDVRRRPEYAAQQRQKAEQRTQPALPAHGPSQQRDKHPCRENHHEGEHGAHVAVELGQERACEAEIGDEPGPDEQPRENVPGNQAAPGHLPQGGKGAPQPPYHASQRDNAQRPPHAPLDLLLDEVKIGHGIPVLARKGHIGHAPHHRALFNECRLQEVAPVEHGIGAGKEERERGQHEHEGDAKERVKLYAPVGGQTRLAAFCPLAVKNCDRSHDGRG